MVRNACFKVIKLTSTTEMGEHVVAQGGAFANDALLRALELELGRPVLRPAILDYYYKSILEEVEKKQIVF